ncbi:hypothetical protein NM688_g2051 [Phlebia brevispora]|uniref:Uncharacterized protein n=1 Tax=Phlebia brevispora TaxID=194682 RepID=A0ACC1T9Z3_9APHY|nr:hypothetical protein NM688_g2051 [Phlebia brevispora]
MILSAEIYAEQLSTRGRGIPLWYPEPSWQTGEVQIGDVGFLFNGGFHRLFNATVPEDHAWNASQGVPENYKPLTPDVSRQLTEFREQDLPQGILQSSSIKAVVAGAKIEGQVPGQPGGAALSYDFEISKQQGAVLILKDKAARKVVIPTQHFHAYMRNNIESWVAFAHRQGLEYKEKDLLFVNGWTKTTGWHLAAFSQTARSRSGTVRGQISAAIGAEVKISMLGSEPASVEERWGPTKLFQIPSPFENEAASERIGDQCVFLVAYKMKKRWGWPGMKIAAAAGYDRLPDSENTGEPGGAVLAQEPPGDEEGPPGSFSLAGPCDFVLNYILEKSNAEYAIASEADIDDLFCGEDWADDIARYLEDYAPAIEVEDGGE